MTEFKPLIDNPPLEGEDARALLERILDDAREVLEQSILVFDLDSTLLNNAPRQAKIMRHYGDEHGIEALTTVQGEHWSGWDPRIPMTRVGLSQAEIEEHYEAFREYWWHRFFASDYCVEDEPIAGAKAYVDSVMELGARVFYVTGRHEAMREGTIACFERHGLPIPNDANVQLLMKPSLKEHDDAYKLRTYDALRQAGQVVAAFDNEPAHINGYLEAFPDAQSVHLATDHSLREIRVHSSIPSIRDFASWLER
jgi:hypothetical protein